MVFSSLPFLCIFLPLSVLLYYFFSRSFGGKIALLFLFLASLVFYGYWKVEYLSIILFSIVANFYVGKCIDLGHKWRKAIFVLGVCMNLTLLLYFKYTMFLLDTMQALFSTSEVSIHIVLPIGISFYTFQQIAYLSDIYTKKHQFGNQNFLEYATFVCFFPQLIAGPIVHHAEMMPQFANKQNQHIQWHNMYTGLCYLSIGLGKKILIADNLSPLVKYCFDSAESLSFFEALFGSIAYTLQLYFDFSGYADMAIGCALFFNIKLPFNFNSPYKALDIQDFWRRWHMTLSRWLRDYLYIPLGGNRGSDARTMGNLFITFLLGGIWHGAGWTFVLWGALHGTALVVHRIWGQYLGLKMPYYAAWFMTFMFINFAWIPFRAVNFDRLTLFLDAFRGYNGFGVTQPFAKAMYDIWKRIFYIPGGYIEYSCILLCLLGIVFIPKNSQELITTFESKFFRLAITLMLTFAITFLLLPGNSPEFIYFQF